MPQGLGEAVEAMLAQRLLQCSGDRSRVSSTSSESLSDGQMTCGGCCFDCQGKPSQEEEENQEPFQPTMEHRERHCFLFYAMPSKQPSTLYYYIYTEACASVELHYAMQYGYAIYHACKAVLLDRASCCCCCFPSDQKGTRKGRRRCFRPINLLGRTSNFQTFKSFLMSRRSSSSIATLHPWNATAAARVFVAAAAVFRRRGAGDVSLSLFFGALISPGLSCHLG